MKKETNKNSLVHCCSTLADLSGVDRPKLSAEPLEWVKDTMGDLCGEPFDRVLLFNADSCAQWIYEKYPDALQPILQHTQITIPYRSVVPSKTPVCFSTIYTGAYPEQHGVTRSIKPRPTLKVDTLIDSFLRAGKRVALFTVDTVTLAMLFRDRVQEGKYDIYCDYKSEAEVVQRAQEVMLKDEYDVILIYAWMYDNRDHRFGPEAPESLTALYQYSSEFDMLAKTIKRCWKKHNTLISFITDHGCHEIEPREDNKFYKGDHGSDSPEDLNILHFMGAIPKSE